MLGDRHRGIGRLAGAAAAARPRWRRRRPSGPARPRPGRPRGIRAPRVRVRRPGRAPRRRRRCAARASRAGSTCRRRSRRTARAADPAGRSRSSSARARRGRAAARAGPACVASGGDAAHARRVRPGGQRSMPVQRPPERVDHPAEPAVGDRQRRRRPMLPRDAGAARNRRAAGPQPVERAERHRLGQRRRESRRSRPASPRRRAPASSSRSPTRDVAGQAVDIDDKPGDTGDPPLEPRPARSRAAAPGRHALRSDKDVHLIGTTSSPELGKDLFTV